MASLGASLQSTLHLVPYAELALWVEGGACVCRNAQAAALVANAGGGACGPTSSALYVNSYTAAATAIASASAATATAQACVLTCRAAHAETAHEEL